MVGIVRVQQGPHVEQFCPSGKVQAGGTVQARVEWREQVWTSTPDGMIAVVADPDFVEGSDGGCGAGTVLDDAGLTEAGVDV